ncbi:hypothetical protein [Nonomuraea lactucae]|uniref:hypothetical protein n=1 Tax=Nonomuraea lactucae TaxID=2249762 RepID=UPI000DE4E5B5|nr:hypothetical protein [Nonomuraea lactucae]
MTDLVGGPLIAVIGQWILDNLDDVAGEVGRRIAEDNHGVTNVRMWFNKTNQTLDVWKYDGSTSRQNHYVIPPGQTLAQDMWIPWCDNDHQYPHKHAIIALDGQPLAYVWQSGTRIRLNAQDHFIPNGPEVPSITRDDGTPAAKAGGDRGILVAKDDQGRPGVVIVGR